MRRKYQRLGDEGGIRRRVIKVISGYSKEQSRTKLLRSGEEDAFQHRYEGGGETKGVLRRTKKA